MTETVDTQGVSHLENAALALIDEDELVAVTQALVRQPGENPPGEEAARVAALVGQGKSVVEVAALLASSPGTVRNHLKAVFAKTGVERQSELAALLSRL